MPNAFVRALVARAPRVAAAAVAVAIGALGSETAVSAGAARPISRGCRNADVAARRLAKPVLRTAVVCLVNAKRAAFGLPRLRQSARLDGAAQDWVDTMVADDEFGHGSGPGAHVSATGLLWSAVGENVATGFGTARSVVAAWMASSEHCRIILSPLYTEVGTGVSFHPVRGYASRPATWAQDFALPANHRAPSQKWAPAESCH